MKTFANVLTPATYQRCVSKLGEAKSEQAWGSSQLFWTEDLKAGVPGNTSMMSLDDELSKAVLDDVGMLFPKAERVVMQLYIWHPFSGIAPHRDGDNRFGATIYLNHSWPAHAGGLFVWWEDETDPIMKAVCPTRNMMILNDENQEHMVTQVSPYIRQPRYTIQIWGIK